MTKGERNKDSSKDSEKRGRNIIKGEKHKDILIYERNEQRKGIKRYLDI